MNIDYYCIPQVLFHTFSCRYFFLSVYMRVHWYEFLVNFILIVSSVSISLWEQDDNDDSYVTTTTHETTAKSYGNDDDGDGGDRVLLLIVLVAVKLFLFNALNGISISKQEKFYDFIPYPVLQNFPCLLVCGFFDNGNNSLLLIIKWCNIICMAFFLTS